MKMRRIDHVTIPVRDLAASTRFYHEVFDMPVLDQQSDSTTSTLRCGHQLIRLVAVDHQLEPAPQTWQPGSAVLSLVVGDDLTSVLHHLKSYYVNVLTEEPIDHLGAEGDLKALRLTDLDNNLIELVAYENK